MNFSHGFVDYASSDEEDYVDLNEASTAAGIQSVAHAAPERMSEELRNQAAQQRSSGQSTRARVTARKLNKNVVSVDLGTLMDEAHQIATGDPFRCLNPNCRTILSSRDRLLDDDPNGQMILEDGMKLWVCRFCENRNVIAIEEAEKPVGDSQDYILERPDAAEAKADEPLIVFCVDTSGSMGSTCKLPEGEKPPANQKLPNRLQAVQSTVADQIAAIARDNPNTRIALVAFSSNVIIHGDGSTGRQQRIDGAALQSQQLCTQFGVDYAVHLPAGASREQLTAAIWSLKKGGQTALGPALVASIALAAQRRGSSVIICTDGCANVGIGSLSNVNDDAASEWYQQLGEWALNSGVVVNIVSITDDGCRLEYLGNVCDLSEGIVTLVNPLELTRDFSQLVQRSPIATHVQARMFVHPGLNFISDEESLEQNSALPNLPAQAVDVDPDDQKDLERDAAKHTANLTQDVGNAFESHKIYFEYAIKKEARSKYKQLGELPFQVQLTYSRLDGTKMMRVITHCKPITANREDVVRTMDSGLVSSHSALKTQRLAKKGNYEAARANTFLTGTWLSSNSRSAEQTREATNYVQRSQVMDAMMQTEQVSERLMGLNTLDMSEDERRRTRSSRRNDRLAADIRRR